MNEFTEIPKYQVNTEKSVALLHMFYTGLSLSITSIVAGPAVVVLPICKMPSGTTVRIL